MNTPDFLYNFIYFGLRFDYSTNSPPAQIIALVCVRADVPVVVNPRTILTCVPFEIGMFNSGDSPEIVFVKIRWYTPPWNETVVGVNVSFIKVYVREPEGAVAITT